MNFPATLRAGDKISWTETLSDYPATLWTLGFYLSSFNKPVISFTSTASGTDHLISILQVTSKTWVPGSYQWQGYVYLTATPTTRYTLENGNIEVLPDLTQATSQSDFRSHVKKVLDAIESVLEGKASQDASSYSIGGRSISKWSPSELLVWRDKYRLEYANEIAAEKVAKGLDSGKRVGLRFRRV